MRLLTFLLFVVLALVGLTVFVPAQEMIPLATTVDRARAQVAISLDGSEFTFRSVAPNATRICVEPEAGKFGARRCFTAGDVREGRVK